MDPTTRSKTQAKKILYKRAYALALITIFYNVLEGLVSVFFGVEDETLSLFGFGLDSFVEVTHRQRVGQIRKTGPQNYRDGILYPDRGFARDRRSIPL